MSVERLSSLLYHRADNPQLPSVDSPYGTAKHYEYLGDLKNALAYYQQAIFVNDRADSAVKDIAGLLNMLGRVKEAVAFLKKHENFITNKEGYLRLLERLENDVNRGETESPLPRALLINVIDYGLGQVSVSLCDLLFPNPGKIQRILYLDAEGFVGVVQFATHSAARKALNVKKRVAGTHVAVQWASEFDDLRMKKIEQLETKETTLTSETLPEHLLAFADKTSVPLYSLGDEIVRAATLPEIYDEDEVLMEEGQPEPITPTGGATAGAAEAVPFITEITDEATGLKIPAVVFPIPGARNTELPQDPVLLTQFVLATAHQVLASQQAKFQTPPRTPLYLMTPSPVMDRSKFS